MLVLTLSCSTHGDADHEAVSRGAIARTRLNAGLADYDCELVLEAGKPPVKAQLVNYPRFAEPLALFVARAIEQVLAHRRDVCLTAPQGHGALQIDLNRTHLQRVQWALRDGTLLVDGLSVRTPPGAPHWQVAQFALCLQQTGGILMPPTPAPLRPPILLHDGVPYCRLSDVPEEARQAYRKRHALSTCPLVPGCADACYPWDLHGFLGC